MKMGIKSTITEYANGFALIITILLIDGVVLVFICELRISSIRSLHFIDGYDDFFRYARKRRTADLFHFKRMTFIRAYKVMVDYPITLLATGNDRWYLTVLQILGYVRN